MISPALAIWLCVAAEAPPATRFRGALEALFHSFPSGTPDGAQDFFANGTPMIGFDGGEDFGLELGADLRLRVFDEPPLQHERDWGKVLRRSDWDEPSDYGQILRELRVGRSEASFSLLAGPVLLHTLGRGHLINRYSNRDNPDYHPSSATAKGVLGPTRTELFAGDILGARLFAADLSADMGRILGDDEGSFDRYLLAFSLAHDNGAAGYRAPPMTLMHLDFDLALHRGESAQVFAFVGLGSRIFVPAADLGGVLGVSAEGHTGGRSIGGKLELRKQSGGFRHGMFGPGYELSRFAGTGLSGEPIAFEVLPDGFSFYGELQHVSGPEAPGPDAESRIVFSIAGEHYTWGRTDADASLSLRTLGGKGTGTTRLIVTALGRSPRYAFDVEARYRFVPAVYALVSGGTVFFPQPDSSLVRGVWGGVGVGADFER